MGSCLAAAHLVFNGTLFLGTAVTLYTADGRFLWSTVVNINATALATNRNSQTSLTHFNKVSRW
jgi:hypothetical protein